ncbi:MAG: hypothetical protein AB7I29_14515 [Geobacter sp.]
MKCAVMILSTALLAGCAPKTVYIPVSNCPAPPSIAMPDLAVHRLPDHPQTKEALEALREDHITLRKTLEQCTTALESYRKPPAQ